MCKAKQFRLAVESKISDNAKNYLRLFSVNT